MSLSCFNTYFNHFFTYIWPLFTFAANWYYVALLLEVGVIWERSGRTMWLYFYMILQSIYPSSDHIKFGTKYTYSQSDHNNTLKYFSYFRIIRKFQEIKMWDIHCLQLANTINEGIKEIDVIVIILTTTLFVKKESVETITLKKDIQKQAQIMPETLKCKGK